MKDINTSWSDLRLSSRPRAFTSIDDRTLIFSASGDGASREPHVTDGTVAGTRLLKDINPGPYSASDPVFIRAGNVTFMFATDAEHGRELWRTDGTEAGTKLIADLMPGPTSTLIGTAVDHGGKLIFAVGPLTPTGGVTLWSYDGTTTGTKQWFAFQPPQGGRAQGGQALLEYQGRVAVAGYDGVYLTDGNNAEVLTTKWEVGGQPQPAVAGDKLFFYASPDTGLAEIELWVSDGTANGTRAFRRMRRTLSTGSNRLSAIVPVGNKVLFTAIDDSGTPHVTATDGTEAGTESLLLGELGSTATIGNTVWFVSLNRLWKTDGTSAGTSQYMSSISNVTSVSAYGSRLIFNGDLTFISDPVTGSTRPLRSADGVQLASSESVQCGVIGGRAVFGGGTYKDDQEPWITDGTDAGTFALGDLARNYPASSKPDTFFVAGNTLVFSARDSSGIQKWWRSDGTAEGTNIVPAWPLSQSTTRTAVWKGRTYVSDNGQLYLLADFTSELQKVFPFPNSTNGSKLFVGGDALYLQAQDGLWRWDGIGTAPDFVVDDFSAALRETTVFDYAGKTVIGGADNIRLVDGTNVSVIAHFSNGAFVAVGGGFIYMLVSKEYGATELWRSDGTPGGTRLVASIPLVLDSHVDFMTAGGHLYFLGGPSYSAKDLWTSDGTAAGTHLVAPITGFSGPESRTLTLLGERVVFPNNDLVNGQELWISDGTIAGTKLLKDIEPGSAGSNPIRITAFDGRVYFIATTAAQGTELWQTDGTAEGTTIVADLVPGAGSSSPDALVAAGNVLFFPATDPLLGRELFAVAAETRIEVNDIRTTEGQPARFTVRLPKARESRLTVDYATSAVTAMAGSDFSATSGTITFEPGETSKEIVVPTLADSIDEENEVFRIVLANGSTVGSAIIEGPNPAADLELSVSMRPGANSYLHPLLTVRNAGPSGLSTSKIDLAFSPANKFDSHFTDPIANGGTATWGTDEVRASAIGMWWASVTSPQRDTNPDNNIVIGRYASASGGILSFSPADLRPGGHATLEMRSTSGLTQNPVSSNPAVVSVSPVTPGSAFDTATLTAVSAGTATVSVAPAGQITVTVLGAGEVVRFPAAMQVSAPDTRVGVPTTVYVEFKGAAPNKNKPGGTITILDGSTVRATAPVTQPVTKIFVDTGGSGTHTLTCRYSGDATYTDEAATTTLTTSIGTPQLSLHGRVLANGQTEITVTVTGSPLATPSGPVVIEEAPYNGGAFPVLLHEVAPGVAAASKTFAFGPGAHSIFVSFIGDTNYNQVLGPFVFADRRHTVRH